ncbi:MAG: tryptophan--tRNA ligase [Patescibacteria group bacterium]
MSKKVMVSGVKPSGRVHIGNYFGAMKQYVDLQDTHDVFVFIANYHALIGLQDKDQLLKDTLDIAMDYLAIGLDPEKTTLYVQSDVPEVTELTWIFNTLVTVPFMQRAHAYKDAVAKNTEPTVGLFDYPVLMAADILMPSADIVAIGQDQKQHIEYARDIAQKFNNTYGETFKLPEHLILENVAVVPGTDGQKMSKSYNNTIPLFGTRDEITKAVMSIVTNSGGEFPENLFAIHKLFRKEAELKPLYDANKTNFKTLKDTLIEDIDVFVAPMRERRDKIAKDPNKVLKILEAGAKKARTRAQEKMKEVREKVGIL